MRKFITSILLPFILIVSLSTSAFAATVGEQLTGPEEGWQRVDANHELVNYTGNWYFETHPTPWAETMAYTDDAGDKASFTFYGTKLRIIDVAFSNRSSAIEISIDGGPTETFSEYSATYNNQQTLVYEKTGLPLGFHNIVITLGDNKKLGLDAFDIDSNGYLIDTNITVPNDLSATGGVKKVELNWTKTSNATGYNVYRSLSTGGPYEKIASSVTAITYTDENVDNGTTYYYVITTLISTNESVYSNEAFATPKDIITEPEEPSGTRAILTITMLTGLEKEYDLSMDEVYAFINWYDTKDAGSGPSKYAINKHDNNRGPFSKRTDYVIFNNILTFEVSEYSSN